MSSPVLLTAVFVMALGHCEPQLEPPLLVLGWAAHLRHISLTILHNRSLQDVASLFLEGLMIIQAEGRASRTVMIWF